MALKPMRTIAEIAEDVRTQDNLATANPLFIVEQEMLVYGMGADRTDEFVWLDDSGEEVHDEELLKRLEADGADESGYEKCGFIRLWKFVTACFTRNGCEDYIRLNGHNLRNPRIYVEGGHRNDEWQTLRGFLLNTAEANHKSATV